jgi:hypothetical protein
MQFIMPRDVVSLCPEPLDEGILRPALEREGAGFDATDGVAAWQEGLLGESDGRVVGLPGRGEQRGGLVGGVAELDELVDFGGTQKIFEVEH